MRKTDTKSDRKTDRGFTLIEIITVLCVLAVLAAMAAHRYIDLSEKAKQRMIYAGIAEYNGRESQLWAKKMITDHVGDSVVSFDRGIYSEMDPYLDAGMSYNTPGSVGDQGENWYYRHLSFGNAATGDQYKGYLEFKDARAYVRRVPATFESPARWHIHSFAD